MSALQRKPEALIRQFQSEVGEIGEERVPVQTRLTMWAVVAMFVILGGLAAGFDIDRVVDSVSGQIVTADPTVVVQPLDPSIIRTIDVHEGDQVKAGQVLATLDPTFAAATATALRLQIDAFTAQIARCEAELARRPFTFAVGHEPGGPHYAALQLAYYNQRKAQFDAQLAADQAQVDQFRAMIARLEADQAGYAGRLAINRDIEQMRTDATRMQVESRLMLLQQNDITADIQRNLQLDAHERVEAQHQLENAIGVRDAFVQQWDAQTSQELVGAKTQLDAAVQQLDAAARHEQLVQMTAPTDAIVLRIARLSVGSVLQPADQFIELARLDSPMEAEIYVDPRDVGFIRPGDDTTVKLDPYHFVEHGWAKGKVRWVSAGTFSLPQNGTAGTMDPNSTSSNGSALQAQTQGALSPPFYKARIAITELKLKNVPPGFRLLPGTTLTADIHVGRRSLFMYLIRGIVRVFDESMREP